MLSGIGQDGCGMTSLVQHITQSQSPRSKTRGLCRFLTVRDPGWNPYWRRKSPTVCEAESSHLY
jgi:hypothetical protein